MPVYEIDGKRFQSDTPLSDAELEELSGKPTPSTGAVMAEAARKGVASFAGTTSGLANLLFSALERYRINPLTEGMRASGGTVAPAPTTGGVVETFQAGRQPVYKSVMETLGTTGAEPQGGMQKIAAEGTEAVTSPYSYLFPALAATRRMGLFGQTLMRPAEQQVIGSTAEAGGQAGEYIGEKMGAPTTGRVVGSIAGGGGGSYALGTTLKTVPLAGKAFDAAASQWNKVSGTVPEDELLKDVDKRISNIFIAAGAADPTIMDTIVKAAKAQQNLSLKTPGGAPIQMPVSSLLADNPVVNQLIQSLSAKDPVFRAQYGNQFEEAKQALVASQIRLFGDPKNVSVNISPVDLVKPQARRTRTIDEQIADTYKDATLDPNVFGQRVSALVAAKEDAALK
jgi:hypothetical protein